MRFRFLLQPGWLASTFAVLAFAVSCYVLLAPWQFDRHAERTATNAAIRASQQAEPVALTRLLPENPANAGPGPDTEWRRVMLSGSYLPDNEVVARLRSVQGQPAFEVLTPFQLTDGSIVLVDRGFIRPVQGEVPDYAPPPAGRVELTARLRVDENASQHRTSLSEGGHRQVYAVDSRTVARATGLTLRPGYLQLEQGSPGVLGPLPLPQLDAGPFLSYALQWLAFGTMALLAWGYFTWREIKPGGVLHGRRTGHRSVAELVAEDEARERDEQAAARRS